MQKPQDRHGYAKVSRALRFFSIRLHSKPETEALAKEIDAERERLDKANGAYEHALSPIFLPGLFAQSQSLMHSTKLPILHTPVLHASCSSASRGSHVPLLVGHVRSVRNHARRRD